MTAAIEYRSRLLAAFAVALPVPLLAAAGLSLPLPATVERLAAKLVPFGSAAALDSRRSDRPARGSIVLAAGEQAAPRLVRVRGSTSMALPAPAGARQRRGRTHPGELVTGHASASAPRAGTPSATRQDEKGGTAPSSTTPGGRETTAPPAPTTQLDAPPAPPASTASPPPTSTPPPSSTTSPPSSTTPPPSTTPQAVNTATDTANNTVTAVTDTAHNTVTTATDTVNATVGGVVGGLNHP
jgi:hypothetical protein